MFDSYHLLFLFIKLWSVYGENIDSYVLGVQDKYIYQIKSAEQLRVKVKNLN